MNRALPADALGYYLNLGPARSYQAVAEHFHVSKRTVTTTATREKWQERLDEYERKARDRIGERFVESIAEANERHVKLGKYLQGIGAKAIQATPVVGAMAALRAVKVGVEIERLGLGEATQRVETSEADAVRAAFARCMANDGDDVDAEDVDVGDDGHDEPADETSGEQPGELDAPSGGDEPGERDEPDDGEA